MESEKTVELEPTEQLALADLPSVKKPSFCQKLGFYEVQFLNNL